MFASWRLTIPCTRAEAERLTEDLPELAAIDPAPAIVADEPDPSAPDAWVIHAYFDAPPDEAALAAIRALVPGAPAGRFVAERVGEADWITISQQGMAAVRAGRFFVHTATNADSVPDGLIGFRIEAGLAFGTGTHETTRGCLGTLSTLADEGAAFGNLADVGTGTGLLAFAAMRLWPQARAIASDIDPVSIDVTAENAGVNRIPLGEGQGELALVVAAGLEDAALRARAPYDLIVANILAGPLIELAPALSAALAPRGTLILAGLLDSQADAVAAAYAPHGVRLASRIVHGDWPTLRLVRAG